VTRGFRLLRDRISALRRLDDRGAFRHVLLVLVVGVFLVLVLHAEGRVGCLFDKVANSLPAAAVYRYRC
jgi:hypothetical protein